MPKSVNQKQKLLFLLDYLRQNTDETHTVTTPQIIDHLAANGSSPLSNKAKTRRKNRRELHYRLHLVAASTKPRNSGCGRFGLDFNSGCACVAINHG